MENVLVMMMTKNMMLLIRERARKGMRCYIANRRGPRASVTLPRVYMSEDERDRDIVDGWFSNFCQPQRNYRSSGPV